MAKKTYLLTYPDGTKTVELDDDQLRHFNRAVEHPNARLTSIEEVNDGEEQ